MVRTSRGDAALRIWPLIRRSCPGEPTQRSEITVLGQPRLDLVLEVQQHLDGVGIDRHLMRID